MVVLGSGRKTFRQMSHELCYCYNQLWVRESFKLWSRVEIFPFAFRFVFRYAFYLVSPFGMFIVPFGIVYCSHFRPVFAFPL